MTSCHSQIEAVGNLTQPGALLALLKAGNCHNPYLDTVENGSALGKSGTHDPQLDAKALLLTHTFPPCWNLRKSPKRPALPGAVDLRRGGLPTPTLSPALFSHLSPLLNFGEICCGQGKILRWLAGQLFSFLPCSDPSLCPSPVGGGAGFCSSWVCRVCSARP